MSRARDIKRMFSRVFTDVAQQLLSIHCKGRLWTAEFQQHARSGCFIIRTFIGGVC